MTNGEVQKSAFLPQFIAVLSATMGAYSMGVGLGYSSPAGAELTDNSTISDKVHFEGNDNSVFSSVLNIGALIGGPLCGIIMNRIGRKNTMMSCVVLFLAGWALIGFGQNFGMLVAGRVIGGLATGATTTVVPTYVGEVSAPEYRGMLGTGTQLMVVAGILHAYIFGTFCDWRWLTLTGVVPCCIYFILVFLNRDTPQYYISKQRYDEARSSLQKYRGKNYNIDDELKNMVSSIEESNKQKMSCSELNKPWIRKPMAIGFFLMIFQQFTGVNAVLFNLGILFKSAGSDLGEDMSSIIIGAVQVVFTIVAAFIMDKAGRKILLIVSCILMAISLAALGTFFYLKEQDEEGTVKTLGWLPLLSLVVFITAFSIGYGPIPMVMMGELFDPSVRDMAVGIAAACNWGTSFIVTSLYQPLQDVIKDYGVYWLFAGLCIVNAVFCFLFIYETKGKTINEILAHYGAPPVTTNDTNNGKSNEAYIED